MRTAPIPMPSDEPLVLPSRREPARRPAVPIVASIVPVAGAVAMWLFTGSPFALWFAALGPLIAGAAFVDAARIGRRERRVGAAQAREARARVRATIDERHAAERDRLRARHPDVAGLTAADEIWRVPERAERLVVGRGDVPSELRVGGGDGDPDAAALRVRAATVPDAPVTIPARGGVAVAGPEALARAVVRGLVLQLCLAAPPGRLQLAPAPPGVAEGWRELLPHTRPAGSEATRLAVCGPGEPVPAADIAIARVAEGAAAPPGCAALLTLAGPTRARLAIDGDVRDLAVEGVGAAQATAIAAGLADRARAAIGPVSAVADSADLADLLPELGGPAQGGLAAVIGRDARGPVVVDLVADGPHAVVVGMTGAGKSELLTTWVTALCATRSVADVVFLLADFKGGTAFDALAALPHVTGVITDLDGRGARRALESLRAELRRREAELVGRGARDIGDEGVRMPRLVIVVDEFAALVAAHPELEAVFVDIAARGRALGMHLVLGTQRAAGVLRDALTANCPLRIALRVADAADSRTVIGTDDAALLPGGPQGRGTAFVRREGDAAPRAVRIARARPETVRAVAARTVRGPGPQRPWLPELPTRIDLAELRALAVGTDPGALLLGLIDEPEQQRQTVRVLGDRGLCVVGAAGSGRTTALATVAAQAPGCVWVPGDPEGAWDALAGVEEEAWPDQDEAWSDQDGAPGRHAAIRTLVVDDLDALLAAYPLDYAQAVTDRVERIVRGAGARGIRVVVSAQRLAGAAARIAELLPRRAILATASRLEHVAAGGDPRTRREGAPPGRADLDGHELQFAWAPPPEPRAVAVPPFAPSATVTGIVLRPGAAGRWTLDDAEVLPVEAGLPPHPGRRVVLVGDAEEWQRGWRTLAAVRAEHDLVIDAACAADYRALTGDRELPPYCAPLRAAAQRRAWLIRPGEPPRRVRLPGRIG